MKLIIIVPAYNEEKSISSTIEALRNQIPNLKKINVDLLVYVINDGSNDGTKQLSEQAGADRIVNHQVNIGLGAAVNSGLRAARDDGADIVVKFDADHQHDPNDIPELIKPILNDEADIIYGNRFNRISYSMPLVRKIGNIVFTKLMHLLTGWPVKDSQPGIFAVSSVYLDRYYLPGEYNYTQQILLDAFHKKMRFAHVDVSFNKRYTGKSFVSFQYPFKVLPQILQVIVGVKPLQIFAPIGISFITIGAVVGAINLIQWFAFGALKPIQNVNLVLGTGLFGLQTLFFGLLADLIVKLLNKNN